MPFNSLVQEKILDFEQLGIPEVFSRDLPLAPIQRPERNNLAQVIVGTRRCGKTYRLFQEMRDIVRAGFNPETMLYFNFEDERLKPYSTGLLADVLDTFFAMHPIAKEEGCFLFFDEIQEVPDWSLFLRRVIDSTKATVYVTGSSSKMLSSELASEFRGRSLSRELFPLSFSEFVRWERGEAAAAKEGFSSKDAAVLRSALGGYLLRGGYPAALGLAASDAMMLVQEYAYRTTAMDVIERYNLRTPQVAVSFLSRCLASSARELSVNKVANEFKSRGVSTSRETLASLLAYYEEAYLVFSLGDLSRTLSDNPRSSSKVYAVDPGMFAAFSRAASKEEGQRLETAVFNKLRRMAPRARAGSLARLTFEHEGRSHEIDFVMGDALLGDVYELVQVSVDLSNPKTRKRELSALEAAMRKYGIGESTIVTMDAEETVKTEAGVVRVVPAWKWLLDEGADGGAFFRHDG